MQRSKATKHHLPLPTFCPVVFMHVNAMCALNPTLYYHYYCLSSQYSLRFPHLSILFFSLHSLLIFFFLFLSAIFFN